jgi:hypothetical protein
LLVVEVEAVQPLVVRNLVVEVQVDLELYQQLLLQQLEVTLLLLVQVQRV